MSNAPDWSQKNGSTQAYTYGNGGICVGYLDEESGIRSLRHGSLLSPSKAIRLAIRLLKLADEVGGGKCACGRALALYCNVCDNDE